MTDVQILTEAFIKFYIFVHCKYANNNKKESLKKKKKETRTKARKWGNNLSAVLAEMFFYHWTESVKLIQISACTLSYSEYYFPHTKFFIYKMIVKYAENELNDEITLMPWLRVTYWLLSHILLEEKKEIKRAFIFSYKLTIILFFLCPSLKLSSLFFHFSPKKYTPL